MKHVVKYVLRNNYVNAAEISGEAGSAYQSSCNQEIRYGVAVVELPKNDRSSLGLVLSGGEDKGSRPKISSLRPGGLAYRSDALCVGDNIVSVNGIRTAKLKHDEIVNLLKNADGHVTLEVEYEIPYSPMDNLPCVCPRAIQVRLQKENGSFGFVLRGGSGFGCPLTVTYVRPGGPADRDGTIKAGDRLLAVDNVDLYTVTQSEAASILKNIKRDVVFTVEYDVSLMEAVRNASGPLLVEIERSLGGGNQQFGVALSMSYKDPLSILIHSIKQASLAERCGALHVGDRVLAIDGVSLEDTTAAEASQLLKNSCGDRIRLEILPLSQMLYGSRLPEVSVRKGMSATSSFATLGSICRNLRPYPWPNEWRPQRSMEPSPSSSSLPSCISSSSASVLSPPPLCRPEVTDVTLCATDQRSFGFSLLSAPSAAPIAPPIIGSLDPGGPAERSGVMQVGDRILSVNGLSVEGRSVEDVTQMLLLSKPRVNIRIEFDVAESVVPSSGVFDVRLPCKATGILGITITGPREHNFGDVLSISDVRRGGVAHRTGTIHVGDQLLAVGSFETNQYCLEDVVQFLKNCHDDVVRLRIRKGELLRAIDSSEIAVTTRIEDMGSRCRASINSGIASGGDDRASDNRLNNVDEGDDNDWIVYSVEMVRRGSGPLGITVAGSQEPSRPVIVSALTSGGLAQQTGALHVGDRLLAINGTSLNDKSLRNVIQLLQNSGDVVTIKVARSVGAWSDGFYSQEESPAKEIGTGGGGGTTPLPSIDSAVESWDGNIASFDGLHGGLTVMLRNNHQRHRRDSGQRSPATPENDNYEDDDLKKLARELDEQNESRNSDSSITNFTLNQGDWSQIPTRFKMSNKKRELENTQEEAVEEEGEVESKDESKNEAEATSEQTDSIPKSVQLPSDTLMTINEQSQNETPCENESTNHVENIDNTVSGVLTMAQASAERLRVNTLPHGARNSRRHHNRGDSSEIVTSLRDLDGPSKGADIGARICSDAQVPYPIEVHRVTLFKDTIYEDFGFSVSDGMCERGVYINRIRPGGPAYIGGILRPYDKILQVNDTKTHDFDCCLTVPLIAAAGDQIRIIVIRNPYIGSSFSRPSFGGAGGSIGTVCGGPLPWMGEERQSRDHRMIASSGSSTYGDAGESITKSL